MVIFQIVRLLKDISETENKQKERDGIFSALFDPQAALFICNKWDRVPEKEEKDRKVLIFRKLSECWPGLEQRQVHYLSTKDVSTKTE